MMAASVRKARNGPARHWRSRRCGQQLRPQLGDGERAATPLGPLALPAAQAEDVVNRA
jgi:hypothetical protein